MQQNFRSVQRLNYLRTVADPVLRQLCKVLADNKPEDPSAFILGYLQNQAKRQNQLAEQIDEIIEKDSKNKFIGRCSISGIASLQINPRSINSNEISPQLAKVFECLKTSFMFVGLDEEAFNDLIQEFEPVEFQAGQIVIRQGQQGEEIYVVQKGLLRCYRTVESGIQQLRTYQPNSYFGQLAILYRCPRQATVQCLSQCRLWRLSQSDYDSLKRFHNSQRLLKRQNFLKRIQLLKNLGPEETVKLAEVLQLVIHEKGDIVLKEGDVGHQMYIVQSGRLKAFKENKDNVAVDVMLYQQGDYFGQLSIVKETPRQASIQCLEKCKLLKISRQTFTELLGPAQEAINERLSSYKKL